MVLQSIPVVKLENGSSVGITPRPRARPYTMAVMKIFLSGDGSIDSPYERARFSVSVWMRVHFPRTEAFK